MYSWKRRMLQAPESPGTPEDRLNRFYETLQDKDQEWLEDRIEQYGLPEVSFDPQRAKLLIATKAREYLAANGLANYFPNLHVQERTSNTQDRRRRTQPQIDPMNDLDPMLKYTYFVSAEFSFDQNQPKYEIAYAYRQWYAAVQKEVLYVVSNSFESRCVTIILSTTTTTTTTTRKQ